MELFDSRTTRWVLWLIIPLLFLPKINLIGGFSGQTAGVRIDDLVLFSFAFLFAWAKLLSGQPFSLFEKLIGGVTLALLSSYFLNVVWVFFDFLHVHAHLVYALRLFEYFLFFYAGTYVIRHYSYRHVLFYLTFFCFVLMALQKVGAIGAFTINGYKHTAAVSYRILGFCSFPSESGAVLNIFCTFWLFDERLRALFFEIFPYFNQKKGKEFFYTLCVVFLFALFIIWTGSRIALLAHMIVSFWALKRAFSQEVKTRFLYAVVFFAIAASLGALAYKAGSLGARSTRLFSWENLSIVRAVWEKAAAHYIPVTSRQINTTFTDASWMIRIHKWCYALKIYVQHPMCYLTGVGPGFAMAALDGGFLRLLVEGGVIALGLFSAFLLKASRLSPSFYAAIFSFCLNMVFFDVYLAYKVMSLLFFTLGAVYAESYEKESALCTNNYKIKVPS